MSEQFLPINQMGSVSDDSASQHIPISNMQMGLLEPMYNFDANKVSMSSMDTERSEAQTINYVPQQFVMPKGYGEMEMIPNLGSQQLSLLSKRKAPMEPMSSPHLLQQSLIPSRRVVQREHLPWVQQLSNPNYKDVQHQSIPCTSGLQNMPAQQKRMVQMESYQSKAGQQKSLTPRNQGAQMLPSPKVQNESNLSVRSKFRESLAAALALSSQQQVKASNVGKQFQSMSGKTQEKSQPDASASADTNAADHASEDPKETFSSGGDCSEQKPIEGHHPSQRHTDNSDSVPISKFDGQGDQSNILLLDTDVSFTNNLFANDELLQGNGLTWVSDPYMEGGDTGEIQKVKRHEFNNEEGSGGKKQVIESAQNLAFKIESELFKLYGGVNKKYKEKGRSLLFNLKDPNNPELRERVMSGDISPERLCSMTAEELASKELSEWRIAKAEELAQMIVLPDTEVDVRRLVKKTHKGEFQVEFEQDDSVAMEVAIGASSLTHTDSQNRSKDHETEVSTPSQSNEANDKPNAVGGNDDQDNPCTITIPSTEGNDLMQGLIPDDELKDADLPPIVSLDEFMESLDSEPPFENIPEDAGKEPPPIEKGEMKSGSQLNSHNTIAELPEKGDAAQNKSDSNMRHDENLVISKAKSPAGISKLEAFWEGLVQLNVTSIISVSSFFKSGENSSTGEWPKFIEIKGRVRLDAFEKFLQDLRMSRSRTIMVVHFVSKDGSPATEQASIREVASSYVLDDRVGFAEPAPGVELYFCPPHTKTYEMLNKHLPKDHIDESLNVVDNGLIGIVIWRKVLLTSSISPNSTSHHKHSSKKQHLDTKRQQAKDTNSTVNFTKNCTVSKSTSFRNSNFIVEDDDDDVPPGFGPAKDDDDLPEFNFSGGSKSLAQARHQNPLSAQTQNRPVEKMRELISKYGQTETVGSPRNWHDKKPWNDDDDIPEWQPPTNQTQIFQQQILKTPRSLMQSNLGAAALQHQQPTQPTLPLRSLQPNVNVLQTHAAWQPSTQWVRPLGSHSLPPSNIGSLPGRGQVFGVPGSGWPQDAPRSRGL